MTKNEMIKEITKVTNDLYQPYKDITNLTDIHISVTVKEITTKDTLFEINIFNRSKLLSSKEIRLGGRYLSNDVYLDFTYEFRIYFKTNNEIYGRDKYIYNTMVAIDYDIRRMFPHARPEELFILIKPLTGTYYYLTVSNRATDETKIETICLSPDFAKFEKETNLSNYYAEYCRERLIK